MRKLSIDEARSVNGGYTIYECKNCGWQIMVGWLVWFAGITKYPTKPVYCPNCWADHSWKKV